jgi:hypothetical protein
MDKQQLQHLKECESREWIKRHRQKARESGANAAHLWWRKVSYDIARIRGQSAFDALRDEMNRQRKHE